MLIYYNSNIKITRLSPFPGDILVNKGDEVKPETIFLRTHHSLSRPLFFNIAQRFKINPSDIEKFVLKKEGEEVKVGEIIAKWQKYLTVKQIESPINGVIEKIDSKTGYVILREKLKKFEPPIILDLSKNFPNNVKNIANYICVKEGDWIEYDQTIAGIQIIPGIHFYQNRVGAPCSGRIIKIDYENKKIVIMREVSMIELKVLYWGEVRKIIPSFGIEIGFGGYILPCPFGTGNTAYGKLRKLSEFGKGDILFIKYLDTPDALRIVQKSPAGLIIGSTDYETIDVLRQINITSVVIENFGVRYLDDEYNDLLERCIDRNIVINGTTILRVGVVRPQILIPMEKDEFGIGRSKSKKFKVIWGDYYGKKGKIINNSLGKTACGIETWLSTVLCDDGKEITVPMNNVLYQNNWNLKIPLHNK